MGCSKSNIENSNVFQEKKLQDIDYSQEQEAWDAYNRFMLNPNDHDFYIANQYTVFFLEIKDGKQKEFLFYQKAANVLKIPVAYEEIVFRVVARVERGELIINHDITKEGTGDFFTKQEIIEFVERGASHGSKKLQSLLVEIKNGNIKFRN